MKEAKEKKSTLHVLLRYGEHMAPKEGTIKAHEDVVKEKGYVWMGKFGKRIGQKMFHTLKKQIDDKEPAYVFMTRLSGGIYMIHAAVLKDVSFNNEEPDYVPSYYSNQRYLTRSWFKVSKFIRLDSEILHILEGNSSKLPIIRTLKKSMAGMMFVKLPPGKEIEDYEFKSRR